MQLPESTYETMLHGQLVTIKRFKAQPTPVTLDAAPRQARVLFNIVPELKCNQEGHADKWLPADEKAEAAEANESDYAAMRELEPIDGRHDHWRGEEFIR